MLINNVSAVDIEDQAVKEGLISMKKDGLHKVISGLIPYEEVLRSVFAVG
jgi:type II secretory ATPase GspE/PulE/Tfp pilus assembly ATPase PilB-like protein